MDHPNCITPNGKSVFIKLTVRLIKLRSGHVVVYIRKATGLRYFFLPSLQMRSIKGCSPLDKILDV